MTSSLPENRHSDDETQWLPSYRWQAIIWSNDGMIPYIMCESQSMDASSMFTISQYLLQDE